MSGGKTEPMLRSVSLSNRNLLAAQPMVSSARVTLTADERFQLDDQAGAGNIKKKLLRRASAAQNSAGQTEAVLPTTSCAQFPDDPELGDQRSESYEFAGIKLAMSNAASTNGRGRNQNNNIQVPNIGTLEPSKVVTGTSCKDSQQRGKGVSMNRSSLVDVVNTLNGQEVDQSMRNQPAIQAALKERESFSFTNISKEAHVSEHPVGVTDLRPKLNLDIFGAVTQQRFSTSQLNKVTVPTVNTARDATSDNSVGTAQSTSSVASNVSESPVKNSTYHSLPDAGADRESPVKKLTGMAKWKYPTHDSFIVDMNNPPNYDAAKAVSFELRQRHLGPVNDTPSTASTVDIAEATSKINATQPVKANTGKEDEDVVGEKNKDAACGSGAGGWVKVQSDKVEDVTDKSGRGNASTEVYYPASSPYHKISPEKKKKHVSDHSNEGGREMSRGKLMWLLAVFGIVVIIVLICLLVAIRVEMSHLTEELRDTRSKLNDLHEQCDCLVNRVEAAPLSKE